MIFHKSTFSKCIIRCWKVNSRFVTCLKFWRMKLWLVLLMICKGLMVLIILFWMILRHSNYFPIHVFHYIFQNCPEYQYFINTFNLSIHVWNSCNVAECDIHMCEISILNCAYYFSFVLFHVHVLFIRTMLHQKIYLLIFTSFQYIPVLCIHVLVFQVYVIIVI